MSEESSFGQPKTRRRNRIITSCLECRRRKLRCDRVNPCTHCVKGHRECVFLAPARDPAAKSKLTQFKESIENLEKRLEPGHDDDADSDWNSPSRGARASPAYRSTVGRGTADQEEEPHLEPTPFAMADIAYEEDGDETFDDLGVRLGRMRIAERIGGFVHPAFDTEFSFPFPSPQPNQAVGQGMPPARKTSNLTDGLNTVASYLEPSPDYLSPGTGMLFSNGSLDDVSLIDFLPRRDLMDRLLNQYWTAVHPLARIVHRPTFERQYHRFWQTIDAYYEPPSSLQALIFAAIFSAAVSVGEDDAQANLGFPKKVIVSDLQSVCESALAKSNLLRTTKIDTLQAFVMYLIPLCRSEISRSHAALTSMAIRLATMAGLHKDGTIFGLLPVEVHVRRLIWHQLCFLDYRTCDAVGPPSQIRREDFDTRMPLNVDDIELESKTPPERDAERWTDVTLTRIRFEYVGFSRELRTMQAGLEKKQTTITAVLRKVEDFRREMENKFEPMIDETVTSQAFALRVLRLEGYKLHIRVLNRYAVLAPQTMPPRLRQIVWFSGTSLIEIGVDLETAHRFKEWSWYTGAIQQYHTALLLLAEVWSISDRRLVDRIWTCFDYIFDIPSFLDRREKTQLVVNNARTRLEEYRKRRKHRIPVAIKRALDSVTSPRTSENSLNASPKVAHVEPDKYLALQTEAETPQPSTTVDGPCRVDNLPIQGMGNNVPPPSAFGSTTNPPSSQNLTMFGSGLQNPAIPRIPGNEFILPIIGAAQRGNTFDDLHAYDAMNEDWDELYQLFPLESNIMSSSTTSPASTNLEDFRLPYTAFIPFGMAQPDSYAHPEQ